MKNINTLVVNKLIKSNAVNPTERDIYEYGVGYLIDVLLNVAVTIAIALIFNRAFDTLLFFVAVIPLRSFAGGYHANTKLRCFLLSILTYVSVLVLATVTANYLSKTGLLVMSIIFFVISYIVVFLLAPVDSHNKRLNDEDKRKYKRISIVILILLTTLNIFLYFAVNNRTFICFGYGIISVAALLVIGRTADLFNFKEEER